MQEVLKVLTPPTLEPVTLADAKAWARVDITDDDALITGLIPAARMVVEARLKKSLINRQYLWTIDYFPNRLVITPSSVVWDSWLNSRIYPYTIAQVLTLPKPPLVSVDQVQYYDTNGTLQTLSSSAYDVTTGVPGRLYPVPGTMWPATQDRLASAMITFTAGQGTLAANIDPNVILAMKCLIAHWYRKREAVSDIAKVEVPLGVRALLAASKTGFYV